MDNQHGCTNQSETCMNPEHMITMKDLEQNLIEQITLSVLRNDVDDIRSMDSGFSDHSSRISNYEINL